MYVLKKICVAKFALYPEIPFEHLYHLPLPSLAILNPQVASSRCNSEPSYKSHSEQLLIICLLECFFGASLTCNKTCYYPAMIEAWSLRYTCMSQFYKICTKALLGTWARNLKSFQIITVSARCLNFQEPYLRPELKKISDSGKFYLLTGCKHINVFHHGSGFKLIMQQQLFYPP